jgi:carboxyl-terminal processing protease
LPDVFIKKDTSYYTPYLADLFGQSVLRTFCMSYSNKHLAAQRNTSQQAFLKDFAVTDADYDDLTAFAIKNGLKPSPKELAASKTYIKTYIKAQLARQLWRSKKGDDNMYFACLNATDPFIEAAVKEFKTPTVLK